MDTAAPLLVTGAAGFIGARFVDSCTRRGIACTSADKASHFGARAEHRDVDFGAIVDRDDLLPWLERDRPPLAGIVHLGACTDTTETDIAYLDRVNVRYSERLWQFAVAERVPMVYASSAATYGDGSEGFDDDEARIPRLRPLNFYGDSKQRFDCFVLDAERAGQSPPAWSGFKFFNVYGPGERHKGRMASVVLHAFDQIRASGTVRLFRSHRPDVPDGHQRRDFIHVDDVVDALHFALARPLPRGIYNLGTGTARTFLDLAHATFAALGVPPSITWTDTPIDLRARYQYRTEATMDRLAAAGWAHPTVALEDGVRAYVRWLLAHAPAPGT
ncbi:MAG: ADP-glyceromanno-heptose 6-epimerase [bacterium]|nr:ADP-glyceromanno-heptose 6-epimerase [bacterium]